MHVRTHNPTPWLEHFHLSHAVEVRGGDRTLFVSGQTSTGPDGASLHPGDLTAQFAQAWRNLKDVLAAAEMEPAHIARLNIYTTDIAAFMENAEELVGVWANDAIKPACTLVEVRALFDPALMVEIEATAVA